MAIRSTSICKVSTVIFFQAFHDYHYRVLDSMHTLLIDLRLKKLISKQKSISLNKFFRYISFNACLLHLFYVYMCFDNNTLIPFSIYIIELLTYQTSHNLSVLN